MLKAEKSQRAFQAERPAVAKTKREEVLRALDLEHTKK